jgi:hypothetical protein
MAFAMLCFRVHFASTHRLKECPEPALLIVPLLMRCEGSVRWCGGAGERCACELGEDWIASVSECCDSMVEGWMAEWPTAVCGYTRTVRRGLSWPVA